jgi:hypothetical protein
MKSISLIQIFCLSLVILGISATKTILRQPDELTDSPVSDNVIQVEARPEDQPVMNITPPSEVSVMRTASVEVRSEPMVQIGTPVRTDIGLMHQNFGKVPIIAAEQPKLAIVEPVPSCGASVYVNRPVISQVIHHDPVEAEAVTSTSVPVVVTTTAPVKHEVNLTTSTMALPFLVRADTVVEQPTFAIHKEMQPVAISAIAPAQNCHLNIGTTTTVHQIPPIRILETSTNPLPQINQPVSLQNFNLQLNQQPQQPQINQQSLLQNQQAANQQPLARETSSLDLPKGIAVTNAPLNSNDQGSHDIPNIKIIDQPKRDTVVSLNGKSETTIHVKAPKRIGKNGFNVEIKEDKDKNLAIKIKTSNKRNDIEKENEKKKKLK